MRSMYETGKEVKSRKTLLILLGKMEKVFEADGLKPVGATASAWPLTADITRE